MKRTKQLALCLIAGVITTAACNMTRDDLSVKTGVAAHSNEVAEGRTKNALMAGALVAPGSLGGHRYGAMSSTSAAPSDGGSNASTLNDAGRVAFSGPPDLPWNPSAQPATPTTLPIHTTPSPPQGCRYASLDRACPAGLQTLLCNDTAFVPGACQTVITDAGATYACCQRPD